jgi:ribosomal protein S3
MLAADMQESANQATTAVSIVVTAARPVVVIGKKLEHEVEQLHRFSRFRVRHQSNRPRSRLDVLAYHRDR